MEAVQSVEHKTDAEVVIDTTEAILALLETKKTRGQRIGAQQLVDTVAGLMTCKSQAQAVKSGMHRSMLAMLHPDKYKPADKAAAGALYTSVNGDDGDDGDGDNGEFYNALERMRLLGTRARNQRVRALYCNFEDLRVVHPDDRVTKAPALAGFVRDQGQAANDALRAAEHGRARRSKAAQADMEAGQDAGDNVAVDAACAELEHIFEEEARAEIEAVQYDMHSTRMVCYKECHDDELFKFVYWASPVPPPVASPEPVAQPADVINVDEDMDNECEFTDAPTPPAASKKRAAPPAASPVSKAARRYIPADLSGSDVGGGEDEDDDDRAWQKDEDTRGMEKAAWAWFKLAPSHPDRMCKARAPVYINNVLAVIRALQVDSAERALGVHTASVGDGIRGERTGRQGRLLALSVGGRHKSNALLSRRGARVVSPWNGFRRYLLVKRAIQVKQEAAPAPMML